MSDSKAVDDFLYEFAKIWDICNGNSVDAMMSWAYVQGLNVSMSSGPFTPENDEEEGIYAFGASIDGEIRGIGFMVEMFSDTSPENALRKVVITVAAMMGEIDGEDTEERPSTDEDSLVESDPLEMPDV